MSYFWWHWQDYCLTKCPRFLLLTFTRHSHCRGWGPVRTGSEQFWGTVQEYELRCRYLACAVWIWVVAKTFLAHGHCDIVGDTQSQSCVKKTLKMPPQSRKKESRLPCTCTVCRGAMMSARAVRLHKSQPRYNTTLASGSSHQISSRPQPILDLLLTHQHSRARRVLWWTIRHRQQWLGYGCQQSRSAR